MLSAQELINSVSPLIAATPVGSGHDTAIGDIGSTHNLLPQQYVLIDIRSYDEAIGSGGGSIPRAIQLEPEFLNKPDAFEIWLQHFDGTKGCNICIIDTPPPPVSTISSVALWRRLLLGEGDGIAAPMNVAATPDSRPSKRRWTFRRSSTTVPDSKLNSSKSAQSDCEKLSLDPQSRYAKEEAATLLADEQRAGLQLAVALQLHGFSTVCVLEGGFPALVEQLRVSRGTVEPVVINHDEVSWERYLSSTGRNVSPDSTLAAQNKDKSKTAAVGDGGISVTVEERKTVKDLSEIEVMQLALSVALRLNHPTMVSILQEKINFASKSEQSSVVNSSQVMS